MARDLSTTILICSSMDGRVRLTTKSGATFDGRVVRQEHSPRSVVVQPIGFEVALGLLIRDIVPATIFCTGPPTFTAPPLFASVIVAVLP